MIKIAHGSSGWAPPFLTEDELADLYLWAVEHYPPAEYPLPEATMISGAVDSIALWRDSLVQRLRERGTQQAAAALRRIVGEQPEIADRLNLEWVLLDAQKLAARRTWQPFGPGDLLALLYHRHIRLVQSGGQLLEVVMEALAELERRFGDETPAWRDVWDRVPTVMCPACGEKIRSERPLYRPLEEDEFSDYLKRYLTVQLKEQGVIANREVEISSRQRTDIHIDAVRYDQRVAIYDRVTVIIEVKGCWNRAWKTAMEEQLVACYLEGNTCRDGLFLVGWFLCSGWDQQGDYRYVDTPKMSIEEARTSLHAQADALSGRGRNVKALVLDARIKRYPA